MSYRIKVEGKEVFGNNEYPENFLAFLKESGVEMDEECLFDHIFEVGQFDVMGAIKAIEADVARNMKNADVSLWDFSKYDEYLKGGELGDTITDLAMRMYETAYIFIPVVFIHTLLDNGSIKLTMPPKGSGDNHLHCYVQTDKIHIKGS